MDEIIVIDCTIKSNNPERIWVDNAWKLLAKQSISSEKNSLQFRKMIISLENKLMIIN